MNKRLSSSLFLLKNEISEWKGQQKYTLVSLGQNCNSSWYLKETGNKEWYNGFVDSMMPSFPQNLAGFSEVITLIKSINKNVKFMFIEQFTECDLKLDISIKTNDILWIKFYSGHKNTGVHYLDTVDDTIMKIVYSGLSN